LFFTNIILKNKYWSQQPDTTSPQHNIEALFNNIIRHRHCSVVYCKQRVTPRRYENTNKLPLSDDDQLKLYNGQYEANHTQWNNVSTENKTSLIHYWRSMQLSKLERRTVLDRDYQTREHSPCTASRSTGITQVSEEFRSQHQVRRVGGRSIQSFQRRRPSGEARRYAREGISQRKIINKLMAIIANSNEIQTNNTWGLKTIYF